MTKDNRDTSLSIWTNNKGFKTYTEEYQAGFVDGHDLGYDAAKAYHSQVDVERLREVYEFTFVSPLDVEGVLPKNRLDAIFNWFIPHLQKQEQQESDAVEFADWILNKGYGSTRILNNSKWTLGLYTPDKTTKELYKEFINSKTK